MTFLRFALTIALTAAVILSPSTRSVLHDPAEIAEAIAQHHAQIEEHDHAHDEIIGIIHAYHSHGHEIADHDHNASFLLPRRSTGFIKPARAHWAMTQITMFDRRTFDLDRPPRI